MPNQNKITNRGAEVAGETGVPFGLGVSISVPVP
jgi:hypothetical protein